MQPNAAENNKKAWVGFAAVLGLFLTGLTAVAVVRQSAAPTSRPAGAPAVSGAAADELSRSLPDVPAEVAAPPAPAPAATPAPATKVVPVTSRTKPESSLRLSGPSSSAGKVAPKPPTGPTGGNPTSFKFTSTDSLGRPARWDPCMPIRWSFNPDQAPPGALELAKGAIDRLAQTGGLSFTYVGTTSVKPLKDEDEAYPAGTDAIIAFGTAVDYPDFTGGTFGLGGFTASVTPEGSRIVRGGVVLNTTKITGIADGFGPGQHRGGAMLHELGHMVGLDHVSDAGQLMHTALTTGAPADYAAGDRNGLTQVGSQPGCFAVPPPPQPVAALVPASESMAPLGVV